MEAGRSIDRGLMERFRAGDRDAFTTLYRIHHPAVFRFAFYMTGDREKATEIVQDVFVWLIHHPGEFNPERGDLAAFLGGVVRKLLARERRNERRWLPMPVLEAGDSGDAALDLTRAIDTAALRKAIGEQALALLRSYRKRGTVEQIGLGRGVRWKLASEA